jgi:glyoxylase-like metal-dependent hydrolase (beta-lactamase superfamily II)
MARARFGGSSAAVVVERKASMSTPERVLGPLPPVERVRPGLWSIPVPIPSNSLRYVLVYAFESDFGPFIVDAGWDTDEAFNALSEGLVQAGATISDVQGVLVTHIHPDHYGLAGRVREASGAWVALHPADAALIHDRYDEPEELVARVGRQLRQWGAPEDEVRSLERASLPVLPLVSPGKPDILFDDGDRPDVPGWDLTAIWTPGHSPGHLCFYEGRTRLMLTGDHVLPRITPNIPYHPQAGANPLGDYLQSLDKVAAFETHEVLPAHEHRFIGLQARVAELRAHHEARFAEVTMAIEDGASAAWEIAAHMRWSRPWDRIEGFMRRAAVGEAMAHLRALQLRGIVREVPGQPITWTINRGDT